MTPVLAEFLGTMLLIMMGNGVCANVLLDKTKGNNSGWIVITTAWALGVFIGVIVAGPVSGAHLNPAVTVGLAVAGKFLWANVVGYIVAQVAGAMAGAFIVWLLYRDHFNATPHAEAAKLSVFSTMPAIRNIPSNLFSEVIGTFVLMFVVFYIVDGSIDLSCVGIGVTPIGLGSVGALPVAFTVWVIGLALGGTTGYAINPARDFGPRVIHAIMPIHDKGGSDWSYAWVPIVGPLVGATLAACLFFYLS